MPKTARNPPRIIDGVLVKRCNDCALDKPTSEFLALKRGGFASRCRPCANKAHRDAYAEDPRSRDEWRRNYYAANREKWHGYDKTWYANHKAESLAKWQAWAAKNPEKVLEYKRLGYAKDPEVHRARAKEWRQANPEKRKVQHARRLSAERGAAAAEKPFTAKDWIEIVDYFGGACAYCLQAKPLTVDHVRAISRGGTDDPSNIVPACHSCNSRKKQRPIWVMLNR